MPWRREWQPTPVFLLENSMDRGAWWVIVHEVAKSRTQLKQLSIMSEARDTTDFLVLWNNKSPFPFLTSFFSCFVMFHQADFNWIPVSYGQKSHNVYILILFQPSLPHILLKRTGSEGRKWVELAHKEQITRKMSFLIFWIYSKVCENH